MPTKSKKIKGLLAAAVLGAVLAGGSLAAAEGGDEAVRQIFLQGVEDMDHKAYPKAAREFKEVLAVEPDNLQAHYYLAHVCFKQKLLQEAQREFAWVQAHAPETAMNHFWLGRVAYDQGDFARALQEMRQAKSLDDEQPQVDYYLGLIYYRNGQAAEALDAFKSAEALDARDAQVHYAAAYLLYHSMHAAKAALQEARQAEACSPSRPLKLKIARLKRDLRG